ncbi:helicase-related protein [Tepidibacillus fermentans]|uniref:DNA 3'-5' helicase n=1 Tax=Tepidibacillus fermentans TaxID=1281767 RepID=A0A4R3KL82_9BACI|nr:helicase-related protein [Tepidibacillus fermentans]TCS84497.1 ATP-dependent DNA helicase RecQ [Tepidibacillus fermentans]
MFNQFFQHFNIFLNKLDRKRNNLVVFKGFPNEWISKIDYQKLFSIPLGELLSELPKRKMELITEAVMRLNQSPDIYWCTYEELITASKDTIETFADVHILNNNLYQYYYPLTYSIDEIDHIYLEYYEDIDNHHDIPDEIQYISSYYGNILKTRNGRFYVSYIDNYGEIDLFNNEKDISSFPITKTAQNFIELSEDEEPFLELISQLSKNSKEIKALHFTWKGDIQQFSQNYLNRIQILQSLLPDLKIYQYQKKTESKGIAREKEYEKILKKYWGYDHFRPLRMYKNVDDIENPKEIIYISQSQIIDDIVTQAELAYKDETFRDVFTTSPTGAGKSVMFQVPAIYLAEKYNLLTIVISPLIGLMKDQVYGLHERNVYFSATINSEISPVEKMNISTKIANGEISILYISPETLLSRSDISMLIGDRKVGLFVIDEAHIVTTWGKAFRSDYWYLGSYLQKLRKQMKFPVATFTATAIYGGIEDMYSETRDSLMLINPINYFGYVKRENIKVSLKSVSFTSTKEQEYRLQKYSLLHERLKRSYKRKKKVLVYFPFVSILRQFNDYILAHANHELANSVSTYYGTMKKEEKNESFLKFKNGDSLIMLATKAFGMGIDIPDIDTVIHFAPTGNVCDYVQEIGRAARSLDEGKAYFDFLPKDFNHVKKLHGISTIRKAQLIQVMDKILMLYKKEKSNKPARNLLVSSEEFRYIFERNFNSDQDDDLDNKLKTALLIIEKDFINKMGYSPIIARPRNIFSIEYMKVKREIEDDFVKTYGPYIQKIKSLNEEYFGGIYKFNLKELWEIKYKDMTFPKFKFLLHHKDDNLKFKHIEFIESVLNVEIDLQNKNQYQFLKNIEDTISKIEKLFSPYIYNQEYFSLNSLTTSVSSLFRKSKYQSEAIANQLIQSIISYQDVVNRNQNHRLSIITKRENQSEIKYKVFPNLNEFTRFLNHHVNKLLQMSALNYNENYEVYLPKSHTYELEKTFISLGLLKCLTCYCMKLGVEITLKSLYVLTRNSK